MNALGRNGRVGIVIPTNNVISEPELAAYGMDLGITFHAARLDVTGTGLDALREMASRTAQAIAELSVAGMDFYLYGCMSTSFIPPFSWERDFKDLVAEATGRESDTAAGATVAALRELGATRIGVLSAYVGDTLDQLLPFLLAHGIEAVRVETLAIDDLREVGRIEPDRIREAAARLVADEVEAICIAGTDLPVAGLAGELKRDLGRPIVAVNQAMLWSACRRLGVDASPLLDAMTNERGASG